MGGTLPRCLPHPLASAWARPFGPLAPLEKMRDHHHCRATDRPCARRRPRPSRTRATAPQAVALTTTVTSLSSVTPSTATYSTARTLKGKLATSAGKILPGRSVAIQAWNPTTSTWITADTVTTDTKGAWSWARPFVEQTVKHRARYGGSSTYAADSSGSLTATVKAGVTWSSKPATTPYTVRGATVTAAGTAIPGEATVSLQRYYSRAWHTISTQSVTDGAFSFPVAMTTASTRTATATTWRGAGFWVSRRMRRRRWMPPAPVRRSSRPPRPWLAQRAGVRDLLERHEVRLDGCPQPPADALQCHRFPWRQGPNRDVTAACVGPYP